VQAADAPAAREGYGNKGGLPLSMDCASEHG
jgi:hypothetical protein